MALQKYIPSADAPHVNLKPLTLSSKANAKAQNINSDRSCMEGDVDIDLREVYFLIMHFLSTGPCHRTYGQLWNELLEHQLLPRRYHAWYSRSGIHSGDENDNGSSFPLSYNKLVERYPHVEKDHLVKLLKQLLLGTAASSQGVIGRNLSSAAAVPTILGTGSFSLLSHGESVNNEVKRPPGYMRWPHMQADQVRGLHLREIGGGFSRHHRAPSVRAACYAILKPSTLMEKMQNVKRLRGHRNAVYCAILDRLGRYVITGSDDRLVKIWSMETAYCLASCRGHEGDITDLAVSVNNVLVASASNDCVIRIWRLPDGLPISVLRGHTAAVTAIVFSPRSNSMFQLLSSADDGTCRIWDARHSQFSPRIYIPKPSESLAGKSNGPSSSIGQQSHQIFCCAFNSSGTVFVTGSSDTYARVWNATKPINDDPEQPNHEMDVLAGHENDVNYVQFSGCAVTSRLSLSDASKDDNIPKFKNSWCTHDNIVTCSRDGSAIIWIPKSRRSHGKVGRWTRAYHLKVPPPPMPPQPSRGGPRQRVLPTPRGVNMIVWSLDNRFVLAAIMDCRICVWNAVDGSLVHSLTGHTESTYVLDVHPFNPRIAMSAGYDGKTIVWDIWEGKPIQVYDIARFKLVDGKFSPDGTSIILSDDVGQLHILSTGQGESQKDAKYDQFFLGDYRPLIHDTHGNILDQETQLPPYRRNMQDLLCDSGMIPYPEPYQSMYQQRRLGALGIEWRPSSVRFAVGTDISLDQEYQIPPIADLDFDPLPEFLDAMEWEPEIELQSEDNDSEYNVTADEYHSEGDQGSLSSNSRDLYSGAEDSEDQKAYDESLRRSRRKRIKVEAEIMTSSGRRVKRRNLDGCDANSSRNKNRSRKSRNDRKASKKKKSSLSKSLRPQRAAARNALSLFSRITGKSTDAEDEDGLERDTSESESMLDDSNSESEESEASLEIERNGLSKGKEVLLDVPEDVIPDNHYPEFQFPERSRRKIVFKMPRRDSEKHSRLENNIYNPNQPDLVGSSSTAPQGVDESNRIDSCDPVYESADGNGGKTETNADGQPAKIINRLSLLEGYEDGKIRWGGVKSRSTKRSKTGEPAPSDPHVRPDLSLNGTVKIGAFVNGHSRSEKESFTISSSSELENEGGNMDEMITTNPHFVEPESLEVMNGSDNQPEQSEFLENRVNDKKVDDSETPSVSYRSAIDSPLKLEDEPKMLPTKLRIKSRVLSRDQENPNKIIIRSSGENSRNGDVHLLPQSQSVVPSDDRAHTGTSVGTQIDRTSGSVSEDSQNLPSRDRMFRAVYQRSKSLRSRGNSENDGGGMEESTSNAGKNNLDEENEATNQGARRTRSMGLGTTSRDLKTVNNHVNLRGLRNSSEDASTSIEERSVADGGDELPHEEWRSSSRINVGLRSARSRRGSNYTREKSPPGRRKQNQPAKSSWLMLSTHEEGSRYIPQLGDEVVYLRQGHQDYIDKSRSREVGPWKKIKGNIRAVEFCTVKDLDYATVPGSGESCCKMRLEFVDPTSTVIGKSFELTLPDLIDFPDFLVERSRYDAAIERKWTNRDKCQVWWKNDGSENGGDWWEGRVKSVQPKSPDFPDSPWDRFAVQYKGDTGLLLHSPWELYDAGTQWEEPQIDSEVRDKLVNALVKLEQSGNKAQDRYGVQRLKQESQKTTFVNRYAVPMTLEVIRLRLENNYYRRLGAMKHDVEVMLGNAESYFEKKADLFAKIERLRDWFRRTLSSL